MIREFDQLLRQRLGTWNKVGYNQGIREVAGEYVWIDSACYSYLQGRRGVLKNKDLEAGVDCLEQVMGSSWW